MREQDYLSYAWLTQFWVRGSHQAVPNEPRPRNSRPVEVVRETSVEKVERWRREQAAIFYEQSSTAVRKV